MPTRRCCCPPCYTYSEDFRRTDDNVELLHPDWEPCVLWSDWELVTDGLVNTEANKTIVLKHMEGNPFGILRVKLDHSPGRIWHILVFKGTENNACGAESYIVEIEATENASEGFIRIKKVGDPEPLDEQEFFEPSSEFEITVCVGESLIEAFSAGSGLARACGNPGGHWFALRSVTASTPWKEVFYSDHFSHNRSCPRCSRHCCFPDYNSVITGFNVRIDNIGNGDCTCEETVMYTLKLGMDDDRCLCRLNFVQNPDSEDPSDRLILGPHSCFDGNSFPGASLRCDETLGVIRVTFDLSPFDGFQGDSQWIFEFPVGTDPNNIRKGINIHDFGGQGEPPNFIGDELGCRYENALLSFAPIVESGCCSEQAEDPEELSALSEKLTPRRLELKARIEDRVIRQNRLLRCIEKYRKPSEGLGSAAHRLCLAAKKRNMEIGSTLEKLLKVYACNMMQAARIMNKEKRHLPASAAEGNSES